MHVGKTIQTVIDVGIIFGFKVIGAIVFYLIGRWLISFAIRVVSSALERQQVDPTLLRYIGTIISVTLNIVLVVAILGYFGVETTSFAAILAAAGIAIGMAWSGLLANFAPARSWSCCGRSKSATSSRWGASPERLRKSACLSPLSTHRTTS